MKSTKGRELRCSNMDSFILSYTAIILSLLHHIRIIAASTTPTQLGNGFSAAPSNTGLAEFEPLLTDSTGSAFAFGFMHMGPMRLDLAVVHLPSSVPVWRAVPFSPVNWSPTTKLSFINGDLALTDTTIQNDPIWSTTSSSVKGDFVTLSNTSNLEIRAAGDVSVSLVWQSFDHPFDTLVQGQNFTGLTPLFTADKRYTFRIGKGYIALYMMFNGSRKSREINYWRHGAVEAVNNSQLYGVIDPLGFFYLHNADGSKAEQIPFNSFNRGLVGLHRVTLQSDGNLYGYYWDEKEWVLDYTAVSERCGLPGTCGAYGLCVPGENTCSCLVNGTDGCRQSDSGDFCGDGTNSDNNYSVIRRAGVTVEYTDLMVSVPVESLHDCENTCDRNCTCWGALYVNVSGNCYLMDSPIQTVEASGSSYQGYFKVRNGNYNGGAGGRRDKKGHGVMVGLLVCFSVVFVALAVYGAYVFWDRRRNKMPRVQLGGSTQEMT